MYVEQNDPDGEATERERGRGEDEAAIQFAKGFLVNVECF